MPALNCNGSIFYKNVQLLAYAYDIDIIGRTMRDVTAAFSAIEWKSAKMDRAVNNGKIKYMLSTIGVAAPRVGTQITANSYTFDVVKEFIHLGNAIATNKTSAWKSSAV